MSMRRFISVLAIAVIATPAALAAANWPQWRGPDGQGISTETDLPMEWQAAASPDGARAESGSGGRGKNIAWKTPLPGRGHSSPIVWDTHVFLTTAIEGDVLPGAAAPVHMLEGKEFVHPDSLGADRKHTYKVIALALDTGRIAWEQVAYEGPVYDGRHKASSYASPTPVTDGKLVYAYFGSEGIYAYDFNGKLAWKADVGDIKTLGMGTSTSPVLFGNLVILQCDEDNGEQSFIVALDKKTGKQVWKTPRQVQVSWSTPVLVQASGRTELVTNGSELIIAYDPKTGKELWRSKGVDSNAIHTPLVGHGLVIVTAGYPAKRVIAIRPGGNGDVSGTDRIAWSYEKGTAYVTSPILYGDYVYLVSDGGVLTCLDAKTGAVKYEGGRPPEPGRYMGSPIAYGGHIFLTSNDGDTHVIKAGPAYEVVRTNTVDEPVFASLAPSQGRVLIRAQGNLYCVKSA
jgi:outer membrane protein assembly factor BamB